MNTFDISAILITLTATFGYLNYRFLKLPPTTGIFVLSLTTSLLLLAVDLLLPNHGIRAHIADFVAHLDFSEALLHGMLCFLLFAGAWNVDLQNLRSHRALIATLAVIGVFISTAVIGILAFSIFKVFGISISLMTCFVFAALISPTDPISVIALLKRVKAPKSLETQIAGESLFNDGVGVVVFFTFLSMTGQGEGKNGGPISFDASDTLIFFLREMGGGLFLGLLFGYVAFIALRQVDEHPLELLITLATVMITYAVSFMIGVSGPIAIVVIGVLIGNYGRRFAMTKKTAKHLNAFWEMIDEILNAALFLLIALELFAIPLHWVSIAAALAIVPVVLVGRFVSVSMPLLFFHLRENFPRGIIPILTWGGLRGGISIAMVLSLPPSDEKALLLTCTYAVVLFSILVQGMTMQGLLTHYKIGGQFEK